LPNLPDSLSFAIQATCLTYPQQYDRANVTVRLLRLNLNIDSDNNNFFSWPNNSPLEEFLEDHPYGLGKLVMQNHIPCPYPPPASFTPIRVYLPKGINTNILNVQLRLKYSFAGPAGSINIWRVSNRNLMQGETVIFPNTLYSLNDPNSLYNLTYDANSGTIDLYIAGVSQCNRTQWASVNSNGRPNEFIEATLVVDGIDWCSDKVKYLVVQNPSFFYRLQHAATINNHFALAQDLRCLLAAKGVYGRDDLPNYCMKLVSQQELQDLGFSLPVAAALSQKNPVLGFNAAMYRDFISQRYILAFAGTDDMEDWIENIWQGMGNDLVQYQLAMEIGAAIEKLEGKDITFEGKEVPPGQMKDMTLHFIITGHSLGGGLASAASVVSNIEAVTFNAAGLHRDTLCKRDDNGEVIKPNVELYLDSLQRYDNNGNGKISAYYMDHDILSNVQDLRSQLLPGQWMPSALGNRIPLDSQYDAAMIVASLSSIGGIIMGTAGIALSTYAGYKCHLLDELLYGFLVKEGWNGAIIEDLLGL